MLIKPSWQLEKSFWSLGYSYVAGVDEAGRGALAGPVVAAAVVLPYKSYPFQDSKRLSPQARARMAATIKSEALAWGIGVASAKEVDSFNVLKATHLAAKRALEKCRPQALVTDYLSLTLSYPVMAVPKGDNKSLQIAAASILAKTSRDAMMIEFDNVYQGYAFHTHKGYGSAKHLAALDKHGPSPIHRRSFRPVMQKRLFPQGD